MTISRAQVYSSSSSCVLFKVTTDQVLVFYWIAGSSQENCSKQNWVVRKPVKVIPLKLFYNQTFFETWRNEYSWYEHYKNAIKKWGHRACLRVSKLLKWGILTGCVFKVRIRNLHSELNLGYFKGTKFCLESKASFIDISSIAPFKQFLIAWSREYCTFSDSSVVTLKSPTWLKYTQLGTIFQKKIMFYYQTFFPLQICSSYDCS